MDIKVTGTVKHGGKWYGPNDVIEGVEQSEGERVIKIGAGIEIKKSAEQIAAEEAEERKSSEEKAKKEADKQLKTLRKKAADLGIEGVGEKDAETLTAEIAAAEQK